MAAQDEVTHTKWYQKRYLGRADDKCRVCETRTERLVHILSSCPGYLWGLIKQGHNKVVYLLAGSITWSLGLTVPKALRGQEGATTPGTWGT